MRACRLNAARWAFLLEVFVIAAQDTRINGEIHAPQLLVIGVDGTKYEMSNDAAQRFAEDQGLDLVEVAPNAEPPVCRVMDYGKMFGKVFMSHCQDEDLVGHGQINEGKVSTRLALEGWPAAGEELQIARDIEIAKLTGAKLHIQHISTAHGLEIVRAGKAAGVQVTCEATPHHMFLTENDLDETYNTSLKVNPPLRTEEDAEAIRQGVIDGTVDAIVTDHAPHTPWEKAREFELAPFGMIGLETSLSLVLTELVNTGKMSVGRMVELMAIKPREILGLDQVQVKAGSVADLTVFDPSATWTVGEDGYESRAENSGFAGRTLTGRATDVFVGGKQTLADGCIC